MDQLGPAKERELLGAGSQGEVKSDFPRGRLGRLGLALILHTTPALSKVGNYNCPSERLGEGAPWGAASEMGPYWGGMELGLRTAHLDCLLLSCKVRRVLETGQWGVLRDGGEGP